MSANSDDRAGGKSAEQAGKPAAPPAAPSLASWNERQQRALKLLARHPGAAPLLEFLLDLIELQRGVFRWSTTAALGGAVHALENELPRLRLDRLPLEILQPRFAEFIGAARSRATEVLADLARRLISGGPEPQSAALSAFLSRQPLDELAAAIDCDSRQLEFFPRAFIQPIAEFLAAGLGAVPEQWHETFCPHCGHPPQLAILRDDALVKSRRLLECSLCRTQWPFRRAVCLHCGESKSEQLEFHSPEDFPHVRVEECRTCHAYFKTIDMRKNGLAVPVIEEIASVELDLWADERGLWKLQRNLLGM